MFYQNKMVKDNLRGSERYTLHRYTHIISTNISIITLNLTYACP